MNRQNTEISSAEVPSRAWLMGTAGWLVPGAGHLLQGYWLRAILLGGSVWICFICGFLMGGHLFRFTGGGEGFTSILQIPPMIGNLGTGLLYIVCWLLGIGFANEPEQAALATFEYGWTLLIIAGLLNYLSMLDAFDIAAGRKS